MTLAPSTAPRGGRVGTLDDAAALTPDVHIYVRSKLPWVALPGGIPSFDAYYDSRKLWPPASLRASPCDLRMSFCLALR